MRPDKLRAWLQRQRVGASRLHLEHESAEGESKVFATFPVEPLPDVQLIFDACGDLADALEEAVRVAIVMVNEDGLAIARTFHKQVPLEAASPDALGASDVSPNSIVAQLLRHIEVQQRAVTGSHGAIYDAFERTINQLQKANEKLLAQNTALTEALRNLEAAQGTEETQEQREESIARTQAWEKFSELGPVVVDFMLKAANAKFSNGHAAAGNVAGTASVVD